MLSLSFSSFMLFLLFVLLSIKDTIAHTDKGKQNFVVNEDGNDIARNHLISEEKQVFEGRKRMLEQRNMKQSSKKIEAMPSKLNCRNSHSDNVKVNRGSFTAFSADYHMPRTHPPKNN